MIQGRFESYERPPEVRSGEKDKVLYCYEEEEIRKEEGEKMKKKSAHSW